ncbi:MAG: type II toxin-antitoxin system RelE/ParE family toxin, partial [Desulfobacterales bacterium]
MIKSFKCKEVDRVFKGRFPKKLSQNMQLLAACNLTMLNFAASLNDLRLPLANRLEALSGDRKDQYSIRINQQWRICFDWHQDGAYSVEIVD